MFKLKSFQKGEVISRAGTINYNAIIVLKGLVRAYTLTSKGDEVTLAFATQGMELASPKSIFQGLPSIDIIEALESTIVLEIDVRKFEELSAKNLRFSKYQNHILKKSVIYTTDRIEFYLTLTSEERFFYLQKHNPELIQRVPQKYLASYIRLTEVSLSRLKSKLSSKVKV